MAKKETKGAPLDLDSYDFGNEFDFEEFDLQPKPVKTKREAVERVASAAWDAGKETIKSPSFFREMIRKALPTGYGNMLNVADQAASTIRGLYHDGAKEFKPAMKETAKVLDRLMPEASKHLPKEAQGLLRRFVEANKDKPQVGVGGQSAADMAVAGILQDTFKYNAQAQAKREAREEVRDGVRDAIENDRHQDQIGQLEGIRRGVVSMAAYQKRIEYNFQRKSLELQARQYFVSVDMLNEQKRQNVRNTEMLQGILNNTALPDLLKIKASEKFKDMFRNKIIGGLQDGIFGQRGNYFERLGAAFKEQAMGSVRNLASGIRDGAEGIQMAQDQADMASEMGIDRFKAMGMMLGSTGANWIGGLGASKLGKAINGTTGGRAGKLAKGVRKVGNDLQFAAENAPQLLTDWSNRYTDVGSDVRQALDNRTNLGYGTKSALSGIAGFLGDPIMDLFKGTVRRANAQDTQVKSTGIADMHAPAAFSNQAHRSLVEVIPGYLARILQEQQIARTGDTSIDLTSYDFTKGSFTSNKALKTAIFNRLFDQRSKEGVKGEQDRLLELVDPTGKLNAKQRAELAKILMNDNLRGRAGYETGKITNYLNDYNFGDSKHGKKYAELFQELNKKRKADGEGNVDLDFAARFRNTGRSMSERRPEIQQLLEVYPREMLEEMGLIDANDRVNMQQITKYFAGDKYQARGVLAQGGLRRLPGGRAAPQLPQPAATDTPSASNEVVVELQKLIEMIEVQNTKPLVSDIKDILEKMREELANLQVQGQGPSGLDRALGAAGELGQGLRRGAIRARRQAQVRAARLAQQYGPQLDAARQQGEDFLAQAQRQALRARRQAQVQAGRLRQSQQGNIDQAQAFLDSQLQRGQQLWNDRPSLEQLRDMLTQRLGDARGRATASVNSLRQTAQDWRTRAAGAFAARREQLNERISEGGLEKTNSILGEIKEALEGIQARLDDGIMTIDANGVPQGVLGRLRGAAGRAGGAARRGLSRLNMRISDMVKLGWNAGTGLARFGGNAANWLVGGTIRGAFKAGVGAMRMGGDIASTVAGNAYRRARGFVDIYVGNERKPRMYGRMLQEGNVYFNRDTNKPIRTFKDITGTVVKRSPDGTEEVVLEENEIEQAYQRQGPVKKFIKTLGAGVKFAAKIGNGLVGGLLGAIPPVYRLAWTAGKTAWSMLLDAPQDIFVKDKLDEPVMLARIMRAGGYQSAVSGKIIKRPSQIDGPVVSAEETVLTHDDIRKGLVDKNNKPIKTGLSKLLSFAFGNVKRAGKLAWAIGKKVNQAGQDLVKGGLTLGKNILKAGVKVGGGVFDLARGRNPFAKGVQAADLQTVQVAAESNSLLKEIRDILKDRLPQRKKHTAQDANDDGIRDGSYEDQMKQKAEADKAKAAKAAAAAQGKGGVGNDPGMLSKLWAKLRGQKDDEDDDDGDINIDLGGDKDKARAAKRARRLKRAQPKGFWNKTKALGKRGLKGLKGLGGGRLLGMGGKLLGGIGTAYGAYSTYEALKEGRYGDAAVDGALTVGGAALTGGGIMAGLGTAASALGAVGAGIAGIISAPVLLGAAAVAAVGVGGYFAYKYLTKKKLGLLSRIRYAQYGFNPTDEDHTNAVFGLEDKLKDAVIYGSKEGEGAKLDAKRVDPKALLKDFDVDEKDTKALNAWLSWFSTRFKPVFLTHVSALKGIAGDKWLSDVDSLDPPVALKYLNATRFPEGPYGQDVSPFKDLKSLPAGGGDVRELIKIAETELQKKVKDSAGKSGVGGAAAATASAAAAGAATATTPGTQNAQVGTTPSGISKQVLSQAAAASGVGLPPAKGGQVGVAGSNTVLNSLGADRLDGIDVVRMKTYGLVKMEVDKVRALMTLEKTVQDNLSYNKDVAKFTGSLEQILNVSGPAFGVDISNEALATNWLNWFNMRFLPTYLNYATLMKAQTGKDNPADAKLALKPVQVVDVATGIFTTSGNGGSVWNISTSPWSDYELNSDVRSTDANMQGLKDMAKNAVLPEPGGKGNNQPTAGKSAANTGFNGTPKLGGALGWAWNSVKSAAGSFTEGVKSVFSGGAPVGGTASGPGGFEGGREMQHPGKGTGGDINDVPAPKGNKSWQALKDTILGAAKMVGVDGKLMAAMAAIESGFNYAVKAGSSSAKGLFQFIDDTWNYMLKHFGPKYGIAPGTPATDPRANALMGAEYIKMNLGALDGQIGRPVTDTDIYMAHFLGSGGARTFLKSDPNAIASQILPKAASANPTIFYDKTGAPRTVGQVYQLMQDRLKNRATSFGINDGGEAMVDSSKPTASGAKPGDVPPATEAGGKAPAKPATPAGTVPTTAATAPKTSSFGVGSTAPAIAGSGAATPAPTPAPAANDSAPAGPQNRGVPIGVLASGFAPPRSMQDQLNQVKQMNEVRITNLVDTNKLLETANETQGKILGVLQSIDGKIGGLAQAAPQQSKPTEATPSSQAARQVERRTTELPKPPVSVAKPRPPAYGS